MPNKSQVTPMGHSSNITTPEIHSKVVEELENGPMEKRHCTDVLCCLLFICFMGGMVGVAAYSISQGNPSLIGRGYDSDGYMCGVDSGYEAYPYLYFATPATGYLTQTVCLSSCPTDISTTYPCKHNTKFPSGASPDSCSNSDSESVQVAQVASGSGLTNKFFTYSTFEFVGRFCLPTEAYSTYSTAATTVYDSGTIQQWFSDVKTTWPVIAVSLAVCFGLGLIYMIILRYCSGILTWSAILCFIIGTAILGWRFYNTATTTSSSTTTTSGTSTGSTITAEKVIAYCLWGISGFALLMTLCLFNRIRLAIAIIKAASDYVKDTWAIFLVPPVAIFVLVCFYVYWGITSVYLASCGDTSQIKNTPFGTFTYDKDLQRLLIYHLFGLLWFNAFVIASCQFIIASSTCLWYFSQGTGQAGSGTVRKSVYRLFRYHFGSIAFGSLILAIVQLIRIILAYFQYQAKKLQGKEGKAVQWLLSCLQCYLACFERFIKFLNKNAYIQVALSGKNFCLAAKDAFFIILKNPLRFGVVSSIGGIFILCGKLFISGMTTLGAYLYITESSNYKDSVYSPFIPTLMVFLFSYAISSAFMTIYGLASDAILACFILDEEIQKKKNAPARHCPESLKSFIEKNKKKEK